MDNDLGDLISEEDFDEIWGFYLRPSGDFFEFEDVCDQPVEYVWTVVDTGGLDEHWYACPGFHIVNKLGYVMTKKPWEDITQDALYSFGDPSEFDPE